MKRRLVFAIVVASVLIVLAVPAFYFKIAKASSDSYLATVDGEGITKAEFMVFFKTQKDKLLSEKNILDEKAQSNFWKSKMDGIATEEVVKRNTLNKLKELKIQLQKAKEHDLILDANDLQNAKSEMDDTEASLSASKNKDEIKQAFQKHYGVTSEQYENVYKEVLLAKKYINLVMSSMQISDEEIQNYYAEHKDSIDRFTAREILIATVDPQTNEPLSGDKLTQASQKALEIFSKAKNGDDLEKLAVQNSDEPAVSQSKGLYTFSIVDENRTQMEDWVLKAKIGDMGIVNDQYGYVIIRLEKRTTFSDEKEDTKEIIRENKYEDMLHSWSQDPVKDVVIQDQKIFDAISVSSVS
ncbi:hypothetical protein A8709_17410 [Paenibacillus pectinilyticus]|uniref:PpiC domain-containing protein n=1 Tax=Paenibacillus pectinilyticus TaxID=512399 RepID=A0A1C0ZZC9_9BACL|nr:peptidylprolyl isomerase [Paenibacillus pectinilyticus]OCT13391.1 hypothetical protein A8709_17410 [Paenibacillus pectinilyticus]